MGVMRVFSPTSDTNMKRALISSLYLVVGCVFDAMGGHGGRYVLLWRQGMQPPFSFQTRFDLPSMKEYSFSTKINLKEKISWYITNQSHLFMFDVLLGGNIEPYMAYSQGEKPKKSSTFLKCLVYSTSASKFCYLLINLRSISKLYCL